MLDASSWILDATASFERGRLVQWQNARIIISLRGFDSLTCYHEGKTL